MMNHRPFQTLNQLEEFLSATEQIEFTFKSKADRYRFILDYLIQFKYNSLSKADKGVLLRVLSHICGYSYVQIKRLAAHYMHHGTLPEKTQPTQGFNTKYTAQDIELLSQTDEAHGTLSGPATKKLFERAWQVFNQPDYQRLANISVWHLYNLRQSKTYQKNRCYFSKTKPRAGSIGERRKPDPNGKPGYIRVDTVHQGDLDKVKGVYYINAVDDVSQFEIVCATEKISETYLVPILEQLMAQFPFAIKGFHADNGSEYVNHTLARLLNKLLIEFTKSRPRHSNDNALVETKNGAIVRKYFGYAHIPQKWAPAINQFCMQHLNPYLNYHWPCFFAETRINNKGKQVRHYPYKNMMTPYDKFKSLPQAKQFLNPNITFEQLDELAFEICDNQAALQMKKAQGQLFKMIFERKHKVA